jgi:hypothetical protein
VHLSFTHATACAEREKAEKSGSLRVGPVIGGERFGRDRNMVIEKGFFYTCKTKERRERRNW